MASKESLTRPYQLVIEGKHSNKENTNQIQIILLTSSTHPNGTHPNVSTENPVNIIPNDIFPPPKKNKTTVSSLDSTGSTRPLQLVWDDHQRQCLGGQAGGHWVPMGTFMARLPSLPTFGRWNNRILHMKFICRQKMPNESPNLRTHVHYQFMLTWAFL